MKKNTIKHPHQMLRAITSFCLMSLTTASALDKCILDNGAIPDGVTINTSAIQKTIDDVHAAGGGKVRVPQGKFVTGTIYLKSHVTLFLEGAAELLGSRSLEDYPTDIPGSGEVAANQKTPPPGALPSSEFIQALIVADQATDVGIDGPGSIDGRGQRDAFPVQEGKGLRPMLMRFYKCSDVRFSQVTLKNPASWGVHLVDCETVYIQGIKISHHSNFNNDGIDIDGCRNVFISDSIISSGDDSICLKSSHSNPCENIFVRNCVIKSHTAAIKMGTSSRAGFRNVIISDCVIRDTDMGAIKLLCVDGGILENVLIQNIILDQVHGPIFIRLGDRGAAYQTPEKGSDRVKVGALRNVTLKNIQGTVKTAEANRSGIMITGIPGHMISGLKLEDIDISFPGMGPAEEKPIVVPEDERRYPEQYFFGKLPSYGLYLRHAEDVVLHRIRLRYHDQEERPAIVLDDVNNCTISDSSIKSDKAGAIVVAKCRDVSVTGSVFRGNAAALIDACVESSGSIDTHSNRLPSGALEFLKQN